MHSRLHVPRRRSAPNADVSHPVEQGLVQSLGEFIDTLVICSATAFIILFDRFCTSRTREARDEAKAK
jgi:Na+/alanine symporter